MGRWTSGNSEGEYGGKLVCHCLLIETEEGLVLVDTGLGTEDIAHPARRLGRVNRRTLGAILDPQETAIAQIERLGFNPRDVRHIVVTHLDFDHAGGLSDFPAAMLHLYRTEARLLQGTLRGKDRSRYRAIQWAYGPKTEVYDIQGEKFFGFDAVRELRGLPPEILLIPLSGHSEGHCGVAIKSSTGWLLHAGDAYIHRSAMEKPPGKSPILERMVDRFNSWNTQDIERNRARLRELAHDEQADVRVFCSHDPHEFLACCARKYRS